MIKSVRFSRFLCYNLFNHFKYCSGAGDLCPIPKERRIRLVALHLRTPPDRPLFHPLAADRLLHRLFLSVPLHRISPWIPLLLSVVMFGMGTTLSADDFHLILNDSPFGFDRRRRHTSSCPERPSDRLAVPAAPDLAAGTVLVGASPGGTASNVIVYLARVTCLSVTMTTVSTLLAPIFTPLLMLL